MARIPTLFDLPEWYKQVPGAKLSQVRASNPLTQRTSVAVPVPDLLKQQPVIPQFPAAPAKPNLPTAPQLPGLPTAPTVPTFSAPPDRAVVEAAKTAFGTEKTALDSILEQYQARVNTYPVSKRQELLNYLNLPEARYGMDSILANLDDAYEARKPSYESARTGYLSAADTYNKAIVPYTADYNQKVSGYTSAYDQYRSQFDAAKSDYERQYGQYKNQFDTATADYKSEYDKYKANFDSTAAALESIKSQYTGARKQYDESLAAQPLNRYERPEAAMIAEITGGPVESTGDRLAKLGLYSDDLHNLMVAKAAGGRK